MPESTPDSPGPAGSRRTLGHLLGLALVVLYIALIEWAWGWSGILQQWRQWSWSQLLLVLLLIQSTYLIRAVRIWDYFRHEAGVRFFTCLKLTLYHNLANNLLPMRAGEASFPLLMKAYFQLSLTRTTGTLLWFRLLDLLVVLLLGAAAWMGWRGASPLLWLLWWLAALLPFLALPAQPWLAQQLTPALPQRAGRIFSTLLTGIPDNWPLLLRSLGFTWMNWSLKLSIFALIVLVFTDLSPLDAFIGALGGELSSILPFHAPAGVGTYEAGVVAGVALTGGSAATALQGAINLHLVLIIATLLGGMAAIPLPGRSPT